MRRALIVVAAMVVSLATTQASAVGQTRPGTEPAYLAGSTVTIASPHTIDHPSAGQLAQALPLYLAAYPVGADVTGPVTLASGYQPICNPCLHAGLPPAFTHHDHILGGGPTAGDAAATRQLVLLLYRPTVLTDPAFQPVTSTAALKRAEAAGAFQVIGDGANPYEIATGILVVTPVVSSRV